MLKTKNTTLYNAALVGCMFLFWAVIFYLSPMTQDDEHFWSYRLVGFQPVLDHVLNYGNGRLLGNLGVFYLIEYRWLRVLSKALTLTGICLLLPKALGLRGRVYYFGSFAAMALCAPKMFAQVYTWTAGFQNYVPCILLLLAVLCLCRAKKHRILLCLPVFVLSVMMQLYVEHSSAINVVIAAAVCVYALRADKKLLPMALSFLLGTVLGLEIMLMIPKMSAELSVDMGVFKGTVFSLGFSQALVTIVKQSLVVLARFTENVFLVTALSLCTCLLLNKQAMHLEKHEKNILFAALLLPVAFMDLAQLNSMGNHYGSAALFETVSLAAAMGVWLMAFGYAMVRLALIMKSGRMQLAVVLLFFVLVSAGPMAVISPIPVRMAYHCYVVASALLLLLMELALDGEEQKLCQKALCLVCLISSLWLMVHFADIDRITRAREDFIHNAVTNGQTDVEYFFVPSDYVFNYWSEEIYSYVYDSRYGVDVKLELADATLWLTENFN